MKTPKIQLLLLLTAALALFVFRNAGAQSDVSQTAQKIIVEDVFVKTANNFLVMFDASGTMDKPYEGTDTKKIDVEKQILREINTKIPDLGYNAGLYLYTPFKSYYDVQPYDREKFAAAIDSLPTVQSAGTYANQPTPLGEGLMKLDPILANLSGRTVVFLFSDGQYTMKPPIHPLEAAKTLSAKYDVPFLIVSTAATEKDQKLLEDMAALNEYSRIVPFASLAGKPGICTGALCAIKSNVVQVVEPVKVTPPKESISVPNILFDFDRTAIRPEFEAEVDRLGQYLQQHPDTAVVLSGYTDNVGPEAYNLDLSNRRAISVARYLTEKFGISEDRIILQWYGPLNPVADNASAEGRSKNRRVEVDISAAP